MNGAIEAGKAFVKFLLDDKELRKGLAKVGQRLQSVGKIGLAATAPIIGAFTAATIAALEYGDGIGDMAARTGIAAKELSGLQYAADQSDVSIKALERGVQKMTINIGNAANGTGTFSKTLGDLGLSLEELRSLSPDQQFLRLSDAIKRVEDPAMRAALAQKAFGKASQELLPLLNQGSEGINSLVRQAEELGITLTEKDVAALGELDQALKTAKQQLFGMSVQIGAAVAGPLTDFLHTIQPIVATTVEWIKNNPELVRTVAAITAACAAAATASYGLGVAFTFLAAHPVIATVVALTAAVIALNDALRNLSEWIADSPELQRMKEDLEGVKETLATLDRAAGGQSPQSQMPTVADAQSLMSNAAAFQKRIEASLAEQQPALSQATAPIDPMTGREITRTADGVWKLVEIQSAWFNWARGGTSQGFIAGTE
jgi:hypothetical protein